MNFLSNFKPVFRLVLIATLSSMYFTGETIASTRAEIKKIVIEESLNSNVPASLSLAVAKVESNFRARALSSAGARGVMQIMPRTASQVFGVSKEELWDARLNVQLGIDYLYQLQKQYGGRWDLALSHYNGGTLKGGKGANARPHSYTRKYVANVLYWQKYYSQQSKVWQDTPFNNVEDGWVPANTKSKNRELSKALRILTTKLKNRELNYKYRPWRLNSGNKLTRSKNRNVGTATAKLELNHYFYKKHLKQIKDKYSNSLKHMRRKYNQSLDDFTPVVNWSDG